MRRGLGVTGVADGGGLGEEGEDVGYELNYMRDSVETEDNTALKIVVPKLGH